MNERNGPGEPGEPDESGEVRLPRYRNYCDGGTSGGTPGVKSGETLCGTPCCIYLGPYQHKTIHGEIEQVAGDFARRARTVVQIGARYGSNPGDEFSCLTTLPSMGEQHPALWAARHAARQRGVLKGVLKK